MFPSLVKQQVSIPEKLLPASNLSLIVLISGQASSGTKTFIDLPKHSSKVHPKTHVKSGLTYSTLHSISKRTTGLGIVSRIVRYFSSRCSKAPSICLLSATFVVVESIAMHTPQE